MKLHALFKKSVSYIFFNAINGAIPFLLLPLLTHYLSPADYGLVSLFQTTMLFIIPLVGLSMGFNIDRLFFKVEKEQLSVTIGNMVLILLGMVTLFTVLIVVASFFSDLDFIGIPIEWLYVIPLISGFVTINGFNLIILRNKDSVAEFGFWQIGLTVLNLGLSLIFVVALLYGWEGRVLGITIATIVLGIGSLYNIYRHGYLSFVLKRDEINDVLRICFPLLLQGLGAFVIFKSNLYFINAFVSKSAVGIYAVAAAFAAIMGIFQDALAKTINPWFYKNLNDFDEKMKIKVLSMNLIINFLFLVMAVVIYFVSKVLINFMVDEEFYSAISLVLLLTLASSFNGMYKISSVYFIHLSKTKLLSILTSIVAIISVGLNYFFIKENGVLGACYALLISLLIQFLLTAIYAQKIYPMPFNEVFFLFRYKLKNILKKH